MTPGDTFAGKYSIERTLGVVGPRDAYVVRFEDRTARLDVPRFELRPHAIEARHVIAVIERDVNYLVTELDDGAPAPPLGVDETLEIVRAVCAGLVELNDEGIVHGALSVDAIARVGDEYKLRDEGFGRWLVDGQFDDAPAEWFEHVAPQQLAIGSPTEAVDIWALGTLVFRLLTGHPYFSGTTVTERVRRILIDPVPRASERAAELGVTLPADLDGWFARCLARSGDEQFARIEDAHDALARAFGRERILERRRRYQQEQLKREYERGPGPLTCLSIAAPDPPSRPERSFVWAWVLVVVVVLLTILWIVVR
jgi:serine/threonine protein kinase